MVYMPGRTCAPLGIDDNRMGAGISKYRSVSKTSSSTAKTYNIVGTTIAMSLGGGCSWTVPLHSPCQRMASS